MSLAHRSGRNPEEVQYSTRIIIPHGASNGIMNHSFCWQTFVNTKTENHIIFMQSNCYLLNVIYRLDLWKTSLICLATNDGHCSKFEDDWIRG